MTCPTALDNAYVGVLIGTGSPGEQRQRRTRLFIKTGLARKSGGVLGEVSDTRRTCVMTEWRNTGANQISLDGPGKHNFGGGEKAVCGDVCQVDASLLPLGMANLYRCAHTCFSAKVWTSKKLQGQGVRSITCPPSTLLHCSQPKSLLQR